MNPILHIDLGKLKNNVAALREQCGAHGIDIAVVTKVFCADLPMVETICAEGPAYLADTRLENIARYPDLPFKRILLRAPGPGDCDNVVLGCDISLQSEIATLDKIGQAAVRYGKRHGVLIMIDMGDLREGIYHANREEILKTARFASSQNSLELCGVGVNLTCYGGTIPDEDIMQRFADLAHWLETELRTKFKIISGGNSSSLDLMAKGGMPKSVNLLRLGESVVRAEETAYQKPLPGLIPDVIILEAILVEVQEKPSYPEGSIGLNAFGEKPVFDDKGMRLRGILSLGRQDTDPAGLVCLDPGAQVLGASSDHLIVDLSDCGRAYSAGDTLRFSMSYSAILRGFTSEYVKRHYIR